MKRRDLTPKQILTVRCPTCGVNPGKRCELVGGRLRTTPHRDRALHAADVVEGEKWRDRSPTPSAEEALLI
jgi:hypothetical protein